jgi:hypothetical protein
MIKHGFRFLGLSGVFLALACSSASKNGAVHAPLFYEHGLPFPSAPKVGKAEKVWSAQLDGYITDLAVAKKSDAVWVGTAPNRDADPGQKVSSKYQLRYFGKGGTKHWSLDTIGPIKAIDLDSMGERAVITTHDESMMALNDSGEILWQVEADCRPIVLDSIHKIVCYHDDDADPHVAFDVYSWEGKKQISYPIAGDILGLKISPSQKYLALSLTRGRIILFRTHEFRTVWQRNVEGEIADFSLSEGADTVAVVSSGKRPDEVDASQTLTLFDHAGNLISTQGMPGHAEQFDIAPDGRALFFYGNSEHGQSFGSIALNLKKPDSLPSPAPKSKDWDYSNLRYADYSSRLLVTEDRFLMSFEDEDEGSRHSHILGFNYGGQLAFNLPMTTQEGIYQFGVSHPENAPMQIVVATDDSLLAVYRLDQP